MGAVVRLAPIQPESKNRFHVSPHDKFLSDTRSWLGFQWTGGNVTAFDEALDSFDPPDRDTISNCLAAWAAADGLGRRVAGNLALERFLPARPEMRQLLAVFLRQPPLSWDSVRHEYVAACRPISRRGGNVNLVPLPQWLGRAVDRSVWENYLLEHYAEEFTDSRTEVEQFVDELLSASGHVLNGNNQGGLPMSRYAAWVTWNDQDTSADPFAFSRGQNADQVRASLGLLDKSHGRSEHLLLFQFVRPAAQSLYRPTVADAADHEYFSPPPPASRGDHGWTVPWPAHKLPTGYTPSDAPPRPEASIDPVPRWSVRLPLRCYS